MYACKCKFPGWLEKSDAPGAGVTSVCELLNMGADNQI